MRLSRGVRLAVVCLGAAVLAGCAGVRTVEQQDAAALLARSDYQAYAAQYLDGEGQPRYDPDSLLDALEAGAPAWWPRTSCSNSLT